MNHKQRTILIIDDCLEDRETYRRFLLKDDRYTYTIFEEEYGENGLELSKVVKPDAILLDFLLPDIDGLEFLNELKAQQRRTNLPVVMLTGQGNEAIAVAAIKNGACDYLVKGKMTPESLCLAVHNAMEQEHLKQQQRQQSREHKLARVQFQQSQQFIQRITDTIPDIVYIYDLKEQRNIYINRQITEVLGYRPEAIQTMGSGILQQLMHPDDWARFPAHLARLNAAQEGEVTEFQYRMRHLNGEWRWLHSREIVFARGEDGLPYQLLGTTQDITERKQAEEEINQLLPQEQAARADAEAANRAKDEFLAMVSHDLRNPLNAILNYTHLLQTRNLNQEIVARALTGIKRNAKLQAQLIEDLLDISRISSGNLHLNFHLVDLVFVIKSAMETMQSAAQDKAIQIDTLLDPSSRRILGDVNRLQQVIWNLLSNAIKFTPRNGYILIQLQQIGGYAQITVTDTGRGISPEFLPFVFDRYRQADSAGKLGGLGLGLAIVHHLVKLHGGTVQVESPGQGQGATFTIKLPVVKDEPESLKTNN